MTAQPDVRVIPLCEADRSSLSDVMAEQRDDWVAALDWDLADINAALLEAVRTGTISGAAAVTAERVVGFGFFTVEVDRCLLGDAFITRAFRTESVYAAIVDELLRQAGEVRPLKRVENHTIGIATDVADAVLGERGFDLHEREYLERAAVAEEGAPAGHMRVRMRAWDEVDFARAAEVIYQAYRGTADAKVNCQYRSRDGCADLLDALTNTVWCGRFDPETTRVALDAETGKLCGVSIATRISAKTVHLGQVSVLPVYQGQGIGRSLVRATIDAAARNGLERCSLAVTKANRVAEALYRDLGFESRREFRVYTRDSQ